jgi:hypothetical protein
MIYHFANNIMRHFYVSKKAQKAIDQIKKQLKVLAKEGYILDFVEDSHVIVHVAKLKNEMKKPFKDIDTCNYVADVIKS